MTKVKDSFIVCNEQGLHTRPATELVKCVSRYRAQVKLFYQDLEVNAKSLLGILMLAAERGAKVRIEAEGEDAQEVVSELIELSKDKFHIRY
ncbi:MAG: HPr family phosphocarrier protein [Candidatus Algichlamydia australiensis]|nr:HPr family phosphocarrier protein [Chlamydiales bacterium]